MGMWSGGGIINQTSKMSPIINPSHHPDSGARVCRERQVHHFRVRYLCNSVIRSCFCAHAGGIFASRPVSERSAYQMHLIRSIGPGPGFLGLGRVALSGHTQGTSGQVPGQRSRPPILGSSPGVKARFIGATVPQGQSVGQGIKLCVGNMPEEAVSHVGVA
jgi:hypothetical protein